MLMSQLIFWFLHQFTSADVCWHTPHYLQSARLQPGPLHRDCNVSLAAALSSVILPNIRKCLGWLVTCSLGCSIKYILALLTIYFLKFHTYQLSLSSPDPITKSYSEFLPLSHYELIWSSTSREQGIASFSGYFYSSLALLWYFIFREVWHQTWPRVGI